MRMNDSSFRLSSSSDTDEPPVNKNKRSADRCERCKKLIRKAAWSEMKTVKTAEEADALSELLDKTINIGDRFC